MKNIFTFYILLLLGFFLNAQNLKSPDNNLDLNFSIDEKGRAFYSLNFHDKPVILNSGLGFMLKDNVEWMKIDTLDMMNNFKILNVTFNSVDEYWNPVWGEESEIRNNYNEMFVELQQIESERKVNIRFRLFDDSLGFRYEFPLQEKLGSFIIIDEKTEFASKEYFPHISLFYGNANEDLKKNLCRELAIPNEIYLEKISLVKIHKNIEQWETFETFYLKK